jgi:hypothetical protein
MLRPLAGLIAVEKNNVAPFALDSCEQLMRTPSKRQPRRSRSWGRSITSRRRDARKSAPRLRPGASGPPAREVAATQANRIFAHSRHGGSSYGER